MTKCLPVEELDIAELVEVIRECAALNLARAKRDRLNGDYPEAEEQEHRAEVLSSLALRFERVAES